MKRRPNLFACLLPFFAFLTFALQLPAQSPTAKADDLFAREDWAAAAKAYTAYLNDHEDLAAKERMAVCWENLGEWEKAEKTRTELVFAQGSGPDAKFRLAQLLQRQGKYDAAKVWYEKYAEEGPDSVEAWRLAKHAGEAILFKKDSLGYQVTPVAAINTRGSEQLPLLNGGDLVYVSDRKGGRPAVWLASRSPDGRVGKSVRAPRKTWDKGFKKGVHYTVPGLQLTELAEGIRTIAYTSDGRTMIFSLRNGNHLDLYIAHRPGKEWTDIENLGDVVNTTGDEAYPYLTNDSTLYFSSNSDEGLGGFDIYSVRCIGGKWIEKRHEGAPLNSPYDDYGFCMQYRQPVGYFTSNRPGGNVEKRGRGGKEDIYAYRRFKVLEGQVVDSRTQLPLKDVKVEIVDINQHTHYYRTDAMGRFRHYFRAGQEVFAKFFLKDYSDKMLNLNARQVGYDQNLSVTIPMDELQRFLITGTVKDARTKEAISDATVRLVGPADVRTFTNKRGEFNQPLRHSTQYRAIFFKEGYIPEIVEITTGPEDQPQRYDQAILLRKGGFYYLEGRTVDIERDIVVGGADVRYLAGSTQKEREQVALGQDGMLYKVLDADRDHTVIASKANYLSARVDLPRAEGRTDTLLRDLQLVPLMPDKVWKTVYFPYRSQTVDSAGWREITEMVYMLLANPEIGLEISAFTDARGGAAFNKELSKKRAELLAGQIASRGIDRKRIWTIGRGEEGLFNNCMDGVDCSEELHAQNRRAEVKVVRIKDMQPQ